MYRGSEDNYRKLFSPSSMWVLRIELRPSGLAASKPLYLRSHLMTHVGLLLIFDFCQFNYVCQHAGLSCLFYLRVCCVSFMFIKFGVF